MNILLTLIQPWNIQRWHSGECAASRTDERNRGGNVFVFSMLVIPFFVKINMVEPTRPFLLVMNFYTSLFLAKKLHFIDSEILHLIKKRALRCQMHTYWPDTRGICVTLNGGHRSWHWPIRHSWYRWIKGERAMRKCGGRSKTAWKMHCFLRPKIYLHWNPPH